MCAAPHHKPPERMKPAAKLLGYALMLGLLALVFAMYGQPDFMLTLANQVWGCF